jgi:hypothetical protein
MRKLLALLLIIPFLSFGQTEKVDYKKEIKKVFKYATFYGAVNGGNSISDVDIYSITNGLETQTVVTPFDYSVTFGIRKIARMGYEPKEAFKNGTENSYSDAATIGKVNGFEFLFEADYKRQQGENYLDQHHFLRYIADDGCGNKYCWKHYILKVEYLQDGFADIEYFEASERYRYKVNNKFSFNIGAVQRLSEPYGYDPLEEWLLSNGNLHYTNLALEEGYTVEFDGQGGAEYFNPSGSVVAENTEVWEAVVMPTMLSDYTEKKRNELTNTLQHSVVIGFDYYHYSKEYWLHSWGNLMPYHYDDAGEFSYHKYNNGQWIDYSGGLIFGYKFNKHLGVFLEGKYNKYWNREWHDFSVGVNYVIF